MVATWGVGVRVIRRLEDERRLVESNPGSDWPDRELDAVELAAVGPIFKVNCLENS